MKRVTLMALGALLMAWALCGAPAAEAADPGVIYSYCFAFDPVFIQPDMRNVRATQRALEAPRVRKEQAPPSQKLDLRLGTLRKKDK